MNVIRVAVSGYDGFNDTNVDHFSLYTDQDNILIKEKARGSGTSLYGDTTNIAHGLSYVPFCLVWGENASNKLILQRVNNAFSFSDMWQAYMDSTNLYISNGMGDNKTYYYFIFYDLIV